MSLICTGVLGGYIGLIESGEHYCIDVEHYTHVVQTLSCLFYGMQRDLKPENILMYPAHDTKNGYLGMQAKLTDFDRSKDYGSGSELQTQVGTLPFEAPEILFDGVKELTNAVDVWGVGKLQ